MNERYLIQRCIKDDKRAQRALFEQFYSNVFRVVNRYIVQREDVEDVVIITFNKILTRISTFEYRGEGSLSKWINTIAINESLRVLSKIKRLPITEEFIDLEPTIDCVADIDVDRIQDILKKMPDGYRKVFNLYAIDGYSHSEIAEMLSISRNTSKSQLLKARKFIIHALDKKRKYGT